MFSIKRPPVKIAAFCVVVLSVGAAASEVAGLTTFTAGKPIKAADINANFDALKNATNNTSADVTTLQGTVGTHTTNITDLQTRVGKLEGQCPPDMVAVGPACVDKYENSVWRVTQAATVTSILAGTATPSQLSANGVRHGDGVDDYGANCDDTASNCGDYYAVSVAGVKPSAYLTWFQAAALCANAGKRLPTNQEWQVAAFGSPDPGTNTAGDNTCNVSTGAPDNTGARTLCKSKRGAFDMVGNVWEWVAEWTQGGSPAWAPKQGDSTNTALYGSDYSYGANAANNQGGGANMAAAIIRGGGSWDNGAAGVFANSFVEAPARPAIYLGFRCAK